MYPFSWLPYSYRWYALPLLFLAVATFAWKLSFQGKPLVTTAAPNGILSYEFSWSRSGAQTILDSWGGLAPVAREQLIWDYPFLILYPLLLSLACGMLGDSLGNARAVVGAFVSWGGITVGSFGRDRELCTPQDGRIRCIRRYGQSSRVVRWNKVHVGIFSAWLDCCRWDNEALCKGLRRGWPECDRQQPSD